MSRAKLQIYSLHIFPWASESCSILCVLSWSFRGASSVLCGILPHQLFLIYSTGMNRSTLKIYSLYIFPWASEFYTSWFKGEHLCKMIFYHVKNGLILSIFADFIFVESIFKLTKKQKQSSDLYSLLLLYPVGGNSLFLLHPAVGNTSFLIYPAGGYSFV